MPLIEVNQVHLAYEIHGQGLPLVLIAGLGYDRWMWHKMVPSLAEHFQVISFDNRGVGESDIPAGPYTAQMLADDTAGLLQALGIEQAVIMGHSMGGFIAQALALSRPDLVHTLVLSATNFGGPRHVPITPEAMAVLTDTTSDPLTRLRRGILISCAPGFEQRQPKVVEEWLQYRAAHPINLQGYQAQMGIGLALLAEAASFELRLPQIQTPTLILFGRHDKVVPPGNAALLARQIPGSQVVILPGAGHFYPLETPQAASQEVIEFVTRQ